jgi:hypothetical protein
VGQFLREERALFGALLVAAVIIDLPNHVQQRLAVETVGGRGAAERFEALVLAALLRRAGWISMLLLECCYWNVAIGMATEAV